MACVIALKVRSLNLNNTLHSKGELKVATSLTKRRDVVSPRVRFTMQVD